MSDKARTIVIKADQAERISAAFNTLLGPLVDQTQDPFEGLVVLALSIRVLTEVLEQADVTEEDAKAIVREAFAVAAQLDVSSVTAQIMTVVQRHGQDSPAS